jgi:hypothetical protein
MNRLSSRTEIEKNSKESGALLSGKCRSMYVEVPVDNENVDICHCSHRGENTKKNKTEKNVKK